MKIVSIPDFEPVCRQSIETVTPSGFLVVQIQSVDIACRRFNSITEGAGWGPVDKGGRSLIFYFECQTIILKDFLKIRKLSGFFKSYFKNENKILGSKI